MKKHIYIFLCVIFFLMLSLIFHVIIEMPILSVMIQDMDKYSLGLSWDQIKLIHGVFTAVLFIIGLILGIYFGKKWWQYIYIDRKYTGKWFKIK